MDDALHIGVGISVATEELFEHAGVHRALADTARELVGVLAIVARIDLRRAGTGAVPASALAAERAADAALVELDRVRETAERLAGLLELAAAGYGLAERAAEATKDAVNEHLWWLGGAIARVLGPGLLLAVLPAAPGILSLVAHKKEVGDFLVEHPELYTSWSPGVTGDLAEHFDAALFGFLGLPPALAPLLGGTRGSAQLLTVANPAGTFRESPVRIERSTPLDPPAPPESLTEAAERIKSMSDDEQVLIEQYELPDGSTVANVYVDGTADWSPWADDEPFDMTSNVWGVAQRESGAARAVELAMQEAGITPETPVQLFGYSQGGIQAALVAHHERFNVVSLVTIGSPVGGIQLDPGIRGLSIGHTEDLVFALDDDQVNAHTVEVTTTRFEPGEPLPHIAGPGHQFQPYVQTLRRIDDSEAPPIRVELDRILGMTDGAVASSATAYRAARD